MLFVNIIRKDGCVLPSFIYSPQMILSRAIQAVEWDPEGIQTIQKLSSKFSKCFHEM